MSSPMLFETYPADGDLGVPVGETILLYFDRGVDLETVKNAVVLYGADFDKTSGPDSAAWLNDKTGANPYFLRSPGFQGLVPLKVTATYVDVTTKADSAVTPITNETVETANNIGMKVALTPEEGVLAPDVEYTLYINGDPSSLGQGISSRTVFDTVPDGANVGTTGSMLGLGSYTGGGADTLNVRITTAGDIGTAQYKWWYTSLGEASAVTARVTARRPRRLEDGLQVRFDGSGFVVGDLYTFNVEPYERLATSTKVTFTTNDGSYTAAPTSPSTPATADPPTSVLPTFSSTTTSSTALTVSAVSPATGAYEVDPNERVITITFSEDVDAATVTDDAVTLYAYPASGPYGGGAPQELPKSLEVSGSVLTIRY